MSRLVYFTSLPEVGGHTTITLSIVRMLKPAFENILVIAKEMPGHGISHAALDQLTEWGIEVVSIPSNVFRGGAALRLARCSLGTAWQRPDVFLAMGMRHLSPILSTILRPSRSFYYHITHDLSASTVRSLRVYDRFFTRLIFISPATAQSWEESRLSEKAPLALVQPSEIRLDPVTPCGSRVVAHFGFVGRLSAAKGCAALVDFANHGTTRCELHVAGDGEFREEFERMQARPKSTVKIVYRGSFAATDRTVFLNNFFKEIDCLVVPSQDNREGIPTVILEALQAGIPVLATRTGGMIAFEQPGLAQSRGCVTLTSRESLIETLGYLAKDPSALRDRTASCREYYQEHFSDAVLKTQWIRALTNMEFAAPLHVPKTSAGTAAVNLVIYTSLPKVGGHTIVSLKLAEILQSSFKGIWVGTKAMPGHGTSVDAIQQLRSIGCAVRELNCPNGRLSFRSLYRWFSEIPLGRNVVFLCIGMRYLPPLFTHFLRPSRSVYYHITHDLTPLTLWRLGLYRKAFSTLVFVCPATCRDYAKGRPFAHNITSVIQASECSDFVWKVPKEADDDVFRMGFSSRLNEAKGSRLMLEFAREGRVPCELHVAGEGEFRHEFECLAAQPVSAVKVIYHGTFLPSARGEFLSRVFTPLDCVCVPSIDQMEGFPNVVLESLQAGVPVLATSCGGLASYELREFGPPAREIVELTTPEQFVAQAEERVRRGKVSVEIRQKCRTYYTTQFSDEKITEAWRGVLGVAGRNKASRP